MSWLALGSPILALFAQIGLENTQGDLHMLAVVAVSRNALVGTGWSILALFAQIGLENTALTL